MGSHSRSDFYGFNCYFRTFITSIMLFGEWSWQKSLKLNMDKICRPGPFRKMRPTCRLMHVHMYTWHIKRQKENSHEKITWLEMGKQNVQAKKVHWDKCQKISLWKKYCSWTSSINNLLSSISPTKVLRQPRVHKNPLYQKSCWSSLLLSKKGYAFAVNVKNSYKFKIPIFPWSKSSKLVKDSNSNTRTATYGLQTVHC